MTSYIIVVEDSDKRIWNYEFTTDGFYIWFRWKSPISDASTTSLYHRRKEGFSLETQVLELLDRYKLHKYTIVRSDFWY